MRGEVVTQPCSAFGAHDLVHQIEPALDRGVLVEPGQCPHQLGPDQRRIFVAPDRQPRLRRRLSQPGHNVRPQDRPGIEPGHELVEAAAARLLPAGRQEARGVADAEEHLDPVLGKQRRQRARLEARQLVKAPCLADPGRRADEGRVAEHQALGGLAMVEDRVNQHVAGVRLGRAAAQMLDRLAQKPPVARRIGHPRAAPREAGQVLGHRSEQAVLIGAVGADVKGDVHARMVLPPARSGSVRVRPWPRPGRSGGRIRSFIVCYLDSETALSYRGLHVR
jgi:hypothetical protein